MTDETGARLIAARYGWDFDTMTEADRFVLLRYGTGCICCGEARSEESSFCASHLAQIRDGSEPYEEPVDCDYFIERNLEADLQRYPGNE